LGNLEQCNLCGSANGENAGGKSVIIGEYGVCNICREMIDVISEKYEVDFRHRLGEDIHAVMPYPLFKIPHFNFPPYSEMYMASSYMHTTHQFAVALTDTCLIGGRRSVQSILAEMDHEIENIEVQLETASEEESKVLKFRKRQLEDRIAQSRKYSQAGGCGAQIGYREGERPMRSLPIFMIPYRDMDSPKQTERGDWIKVKVPYRRMRVGFFGGKKWVKDEVYWLISKEGKGFVDELSRRVTDPHR